MIALQLLPAVLSFIVLGAHFLRGGNVAMVVVFLVLLGLLGVRRRWAAYIAQTALVLGAAVWVYTLAVLATARIHAGQPALRMSLILGGVALLTALSALVFRTDRLKRWYKHDRDAEAVSRD